MAKIATAKKNILIIRRDNWQKDIALYRSLLKYFKKQKHTIIFDGPVGGSIYYSKTLEWTYKWLPDSMQKINKKIIHFLYALFFPDSFFNVYNKKNDSIESRCLALKKAILKLGTNKEIVIFSRSSGGRIASLIADELSIKKIICLGYPFKHPEKEIEPDRFLHLRNLKTPFLIIQGTNDEYGGKEIQEKYSFSPTIELFFVDTNHDFKVSGEDWKKVLSKISGFIDPV